MSKVIKQLVEKFDSLPVRARLLATFVCILVVAFVVDALWISVNFNRANQLKSEISQTELTMQSLIESQTEINRSFSQNKYNPFHERIGDVEKQIQILQNQLKKKSAYLIKPEEMGSILSEIFQHSKRLKLVSLEKKPIEVLFEDEKKESVLLYRHSFELAFEGGYSDTQKFIEQLEKMPQKVSFEAFDYSVGIYPLSVTTLKVSTLSLNRKWIGG